MKTKQTAVDWLFLMLNDPNRNQDFAKKLYDKAKEIEKEQIKNAYLEASKQTCWSYGEEPPNDDNVYAEDYYNKTYVTNGK